MCSYLLLYSCAIYVYTVILLKYMTYDKCQTWSCTILHFFIFFLKKKTLQENTNSTNFTQARNCTFEFRIFAHLNFMNIPEYWAKTHNPLGTGLLRVI